MPSKKNLPEKRPRGSKSPVEVLIQEGANLVRNYAHFEDSKTTLLRELARVIVELRGYFQTEDGRTDWAGRSFTYRETVARIYQDAGVPADSLEGMQSALRYHIGNVLRDHAPPQELEDLGLKSQRPVERVKASRERLAALARAGAALEKQGRAKDVRLIRVVSQAEVLLTKVTDAALEDLDADVVEDLVASLETTARKAQELLRDLEPARRKRRGGRRRLGQASERAT